LGTSDRSISMKDIADHARGGTARHFPRRGNSTRSQEGSLSVC
jgi:hypothetical protein